MPPDTPADAHAMLSRFIDKGDTLIEVGCVERLLALDAVALGVQGALVIEREPARLTAAAADVQAADLKETIRLARGDFRTWPLIPAKHVICQIGGPDVLALLPRLSSAARSGALLFSRLRANLVTAVTARVRDRTVESSAVREDDGRVALLFHPASQAAGAYEPAWRPPNSFKI